MAGNITNNDKQLDEYKELNNNMRHYGNMRFAQLTLYFTITAALVAALFKDKPFLNHNLLLMLKIIGVIVSLAFWIMEERSADFWHDFRHRAIALENTLKIYIHKNHPKAKFHLSATNAVRIIFIVGTVLWLYAVITDVCPRWGCWAAIITFVIGVLIPVHLLWKWRQIELKARNAARVRLSKKLKNLWFYLYHSLRKRRS